MLNLSFPFYLASKSPRRKDLLHFICSDIKVISSNLTEEVISGSDPIDVVKKIASDKMIHVEETSKPGIILTADTLVALNDKILGKPSNAEEARKMLTNLSGKTHRVITGFNLFNQINNKNIIDYEETLVSFKKLTDKEIIDYIETGSPFDKAGAYGIQDPHGAVFCSGINGCYYNVMGLPLSKLYSSILEVL